MQERENMLVQLSAARCRYNIMKFNHNLIKVGTALQQGTLTKGKGPVK